MSNRAYLVNHEEASPVTSEEPKGQWHLAASYQLPVMWLSLFDMSTVTEAEITVEDCDGNETKAKIPTFIATVDDAKELCARRRQRISAMLPESCQPYLADWQSYLDSKLTLANVQLEMSEIWMMFDEGEFLPHLQELQKAFDSDSRDDWDALLAQADVQDEDVARFGVRGYEWDCEIGWL